tara:strand:+ start:345 stop:488 length:144 start_codon:yes stop_codon:yes gene_type:complete
MTNDALVYVILAYVICVLAAQGNAVSDWKQRAESAEKERDMLLERLK